ncbi:phage portal protein [Nocardioides sp. YIM 152315]|uniref:phage portal protein n=1 Tax=Nocardioides sp. YIM 152315 TaxID=3031760 RepID=UPI0023DC4977|nr:phage portal protein [Nocardioides sp. YIM 152315]MDF1603388.1 phage portal protein [Nocardioides sp. YIM 152315]
MATREQALSWVSKLYDVLAARRPEIKKSFKYLQGEQPLVYATEQWKQFHADRYKGFADNWCGVVGRAPVDRLRIDGFRIGDDDVTAAERTLWDDWKRNELPNQSKQGFLSSTVAKRSATLVWGNDNDEPVVSWEHPSQVVVAYSQDGRRSRLAALKAWVEDDTEYATLYLPDEIWKFQRRTFGIDQREGRTDSGIYVPTSLGVSGWQPREVASEVWPLPNPLGEVPVVEWLNQPLLGGDPISDIAGTMAMQDAINMLWAYLFTAADHASMAARVVLGAEPPKIPILDENGQIIGSQPARLEDLAQGRLLFLPGAKDANARIDQWDAAKLDVFGVEIGRAIAHVAAQTSTPPHYMLTNEKFANLNADALTAAEVPLGQKTANAAEFYDPSAKDTLRLMAKVRGEDGLAESLRLAEIQWKDPFVHSLSQVADAATKDRAVGMSLRTVLERRYGMTKTEIDREFERIREEQADPFSILDPVTQAAIKGAAGGDTEPVAGA